MLNLVIFLTIIWTLKILPDVLLNDLIPILKIDLFYFIKTVELNFFKVNFMKFLKH